MERKKKVERINFEKDHVFNFTATLIAVMEGQLWLSPEATGGSTTDCIIINWTHGNRERTIEHLRSVGILIGSTIRVEGRRNWNARSWYTIDWCIFNK